MIQGCNFFFLERDTFIGDDNINIIERRKKGVDCGCEGGWGRVCPLFFVHVTRKLIYSL